MGKVRHKLHKYLTEFHFDTTQNFKETTEGVICCNVFDYVIDFEFCAFIKNVNI